jgi:CheY-like chemotaxis protein
VTETSPAILIVDDEYGLAEMLRELLAEVGYDVAVAINGRLALEVLAERRIDVVLTDLMMPVMDGPELARAMRAMDVYRLIPIVPMTSLRSAVDDPALFAAVLDEPFTPATPLATLTQARRGGQAG